MKLYTIRNLEGPDTAAKGLWRVDGPGIDPLYTQDRTRAATIARALNQAYVAGLKDGSVAPLSKTEIESAS